MRYAPIAVLLLAVLTPGLAQQPPLSTPGFKENNDLEMMTWVEVKRAMVAGKTTALVFNGGTEQRGPQAVNGGHTLIVKQMAQMIAEKLGNAIAAPILPYSVNNSASPDLPGTIGLPGPLFAAVNEQVAEQLIKNGFRNVVLMGDHGGGQQELAEVAAKLDAKYSPTGIRIVYCGDVYLKAQQELDAWLKANNIPSGQHADNKDTSTMIYLGQNKGWVRMAEIPNAVGDPGSRPWNGIDGDARQSTAELGKRIVDTKVDLAVAQIRKLLGTAAAAR
ncbi:MAG TPA: creatininase family protein [Bryobacteraceae bacterium]|nr:creatininase family protein [Bryobacteraceae bacterium]